MPDADRSDWKKPLSGVGKDNLVRDDGYYRCCAVSIAIVVQKALKDRLVYEERPVTRELYWDHCLLPGYQSIKVRIEAVKASLESW